MPPAQVETALAIAFSRWAAACPNLAFARVADNLAPFDDPSATGSGAGDIRISFGSGNHGDSYPFDGAGGVLAHAFFPPPNGVTAPGDGHFDDAETWSLFGEPFGGQPRDLITVATHEFGHALGLRHEGAVDAIMNPFYSGPRDLSADDVAGIRAIYCPASSPSPLPQDVLLLVDVTGSMGDDLPNVQASIGAMVSALQTNFTDVRLGLAKFADFPQAPFGNSSDIPWQSVMPLGSTAATITSAVGGLVASGGGDGPEAQYNAIFQSLGGMGFEPATRLPVILLMTDADFHDADTEAGYPGVGRAATLARIEADGAVIFTLIS